MATICFEGLGRKFLPMLPSPVFYFLKDAILILCVVRFGIPRDIKVRARNLLGQPFLSVGIMALTITIMECFNPDQRSLLLPLVGLRAYWLWWLAPLVIASMLRDSMDINRPLMVLGGISLVVSAFAVLQFAAPATANINTYALYEGREMNAVDLVQTTGRVRVSSTFSYFTGFVHYVVLVPPLILAFALEAGRGKQRKLAYLVLFASLVTLPMSGSRGALVLALANLGFVAWGAGFLNTGVGRRLLGGSTLMFLLSFVVFPQAMQGVLDRFAMQDTKSRVAEVLHHIPLVAMDSTNYPLLGTGTGTAQNVAIALGMSNPRYAAESESSRLLVELGPVGYLAVWTLRLGLMLAMFKGARQLRRSGRGGLAGVGFMLGFQALIGPFVADHIFQSLYFLVAGFALHGLVASPVSRSPSLAQRRQSPVFLKPRLGPQPLGLRQ